MNGLRCIVMIHILAAVFCSHQLHAQFPCPIHSLSAADAATGDQFGDAVALHGDVAVIGAPEDSFGGGAPGSAYVFRRMNGAWVQEQKLTASDGENGDSFGFAVAVHNDVIVVTAPTDHVNATENLGSAYVFRYNGASWTEETKITASDADAFDEFGNAVSIDGNTLVIGDQKDDAPGPNDREGSVYVFRYDDAAEQWNELQKLTQSDLNQNAGFGRSVDVDNDAVIVGAWQDDPKGGFSVGAAYIYRESGDVWTLEQKLTASDANNFDWFGQSVAIDGARAAVGAYRADFDAIEPGAVYFYHLQGNTWTEEAIVHASDAAENDSFGWSVDLHGDHAVVGTNGGGQAYVYERSGGTWPEQAILVPDTAVSSEFARAVTLDAGRAIVGDRTGVSGIGQAYVFDVAVMMFDAPKDMSVGDMPSYVTAADLDGDGDSDLVVTNENESSISILLNNGDGTFASAVEYTVGQSPESAAAADFDTDGDIDIAVAGLFGTVTALFNDGGGAFPDSVTHDVTGAFAVKAGDLNGDGAPDLVATSFFNSEVVILTNDGAGNFSIEGSFDAGSNPSSVAAVDLDGDGDRDVVVNNRFADTISVLMNDGAASLSGPTTYTTGDVPYFVESADYDGDDDMDLAVPNFASDDVSILLNNGDGTFAPAVNYAVGEEPTSASASDLDGDGDTDLAVSNRFDGTLSILANQGDGTFASVVLLNIQPDAGTLVVACAELNGDALPDLAAVNREIDTVSALLNETCTPGPACPSDLNSDAETDVSDLLTLLAAWGTDDAGADINDDGIVNVGDLLALLGAWGPCV